MRNVDYFLICFVALLSLAVVSRAANENSNKEKKALPLFQIVSFVNNPCIASDPRNGTCFTSTECMTQGGSADGSCASGYGVCCVFVIGCGSMSSANCTYIEQIPFTNAASLSSNPCIYTLCRAKQDICRLRLDFTMNILAPPVTGEQRRFGAAENTGGALGDCITDTMTLSAPGGTGSPAICGYNSGQHMIVDMSDVGCNMLTFSIGPGSSVSRRWMIKATQFVCNDDNGSGGPPGCLQYFREPTGVVASYGFNTASTTISATETHLSNQRYTVCFRQISGNCIICYDQRLRKSFGISISTRTNRARSGIGGSCTTDYVVIPQGTTFEERQTTSGNSKFCGRVFDSNEAQRVAESICTPVIPFVLGVNFDANEADQGAANPRTNELAFLPGGTLGFWLNFKQFSC